VLALLRERFSTITLVWADGGYAGRLVSWAYQVLALTVTIVKRSDDTTGFAVLPRRWVVERTLGWLLRYGRLIRDSNDDSTITKRWCCGPPSRS
jgi:transposase